MGGLRQGGGNGRQKAMLLIKGGRPTDNCLIAFLSSLFSHQTSGIRACSAFLEVW